MEDAKWAVAEARRKKTTMKKSKDRMSNQMYEICQLKSSIDSLVKQLNALKTEKRPKKAYTAESEETATYCKENISLIDANY